MLAAVSATEFAVERAPALHIPDGFIDAPVAAGGWIVAALAVGVAVRRVDRRLEERAVPLMGVMADDLDVAQALQLSRVVAQLGPDQVAHHVVAGASAALVETFTEVIEEVLHGG